MARILYGFAGEGSGHSARAETVANHLYRQGHEVLLVSYDRGYRNLEPCHEIEEVDGFRIKSRNNKISLLATLWYNLKKLKAVIRSCHKTRRLAKEWRADVILSDFELTSSRAARSLDLPLVSLDNQHQLLCTDVSYPKRYWWDALVTKIIIRILVSKPDYSLFTCLDPQICFDPKKQKAYHPLLRDSVIHAETTELDHILVYLTHGYQDAITQLKKIPNQVFYVYGYKRQAQEGNIIFKPFSVDGFLTDLSSCKGVIATAGFSLISEALYMQKPLLALPMQGQFEQTFNALELERLNLGRSIYTLEEGDFQNFVNDIPHIRKNIETYNFLPNRLLQGLDSIIKKIMKKRKNRVKKMRINIPGKTTKQKHNPTVSNDTTVSDTITNNVHTLKTGSSNVRT